eukprot:scaffold347_cov239-Pinguiococcus_pyrenoidosus.AAC.38
MKCWASDNALMVHASRGCRKESCASLQGKEIAAPARQLPCRYDETPEGYSTFRQFTSLLFLQAAVLDLFADLKLICRNESGNIGRLVIPLDELRAFWKRSQTDRMTLGMRNMLALQLLLVLSGGLATVVIQSIT